MSLILSVTCKPLMLSVIMLNIVMLNVVMLSVIILSVVMLSLVMLSVIMLRVGMQCVVAPVRSGEDEPIFLKSACIH